MWKKQSSGTGLQGTITSKNTFVPRQCKSGTSLEEEEVRWGTPQNPRPWLRRGFRKPIRSTSAAIGRTPRQTPLLIVNLYLAGEEVEAVVDTGASASVVGKCLERKLGIWKIARKVKVRQRGGSH